MSFTIKVKEELLTLHRFEKSELSALIKMSGSLGLSMGGLSLSLTTEKLRLPCHIYELIVMNFIRSNRTFVTTKKPI